MKKHIRTASALFFFASAAALFSLMSTAQDMGPVAARDPKQLSRLQFGYTSIRKTDRVADCGATAVSHRAALTATHCVKPGQNSIVIGGYEAAFDRLDDGKDHTLLVFKTVRFKQWARVDLRALDMGEKVRFIGYPGESGSGIFDESGGLRGVVSFNQSAAAPAGAFMQMAGAFDIAFSKEAWQAAGVFVE